MAKSMKNPDVDIIGSLESLELAEAFNSGDLDRITVARIAMDDAFETRWNWQDQRVDNKSGEFAR